MRERVLALVLILSWWFAMGPIVLWLPLHRGGAIDDESRYMALLLLGLLALALAATVVAREAATERAALADAWFPLAIVAAAVTVGLLANASAESRRGEPLYLWMGVGFAAGWTILVLATALLSRWRWSHPARLVITAGLGLLVLSAFSVRID